MYNGYSAYIKKKELCVIRMVIRNEYKQTFPLTMLKFGFHWAEIFTGVPEEDAPLDENDTT